MDSCDSTVAQRDCVEGKKFEVATLLTLTLPAVSLQLAFIMEQHNSAEIVNMLNKIEVSLGYQLFNKIFPVILTDMGLSLQIYKEWNTLV